MLAALSIPAFASMTTTYASSTSIALVAQTNVENQQDIVQRGPYKGMVKANGVNIRSGPGTQYPSYGHMNYGDIVWIYNYTNAPWAYVLCDYPHKGQFAYIHMQYITEVPD